MSCFESSTFLRNHEVISSEILKTACESLGWQLLESRGQIKIFPPNTKSQLRGEPAITIRGRTVTWNRYYMRDGRQRVNEIRKEYQQAYEEAQVSYARASIEKAFKERNFNLVPDRHFQPSEEKKHSFYMVGRSKLSGETEPRAKIHFSILSDGTVVSDSNYIPEDIHELADEAMEQIEHDFGNKRKIKPKEIPAKYRNKAFCKNPQVIKLRQK